MRSELPHVGPMATSALKWAHFGPEESTSTSPSYLGSKPDTNECGDGNNATLIRATRQRPHFEDDVSLSKSTLGWTEFLREFTCQACAAFCSLMVSSYRAECTMETSRPALKTSYCKSLAALLVPLRSKPKFPSSIVSIFQSGSSSSSPLSL